MILLDENLYKNILIYTIAFKTPYGKKPFCIIFDKIGAYIRKYDRTKYLGLFHSDEKYEVSFDIRYILKSNISDVYSHKQMIQK